MVVFFLKVSSKVLNADLDLYFMKKAAFADNKEVCFIFCAFIPRSIAYTRPRSLIIFSSVQPAILALFKVVNQNTSASSIISRVAAIAWYVSSNAMA